MECFGMDDLTAARIADNILHQQEFAGDRRRSDGNDKNREEGRNKNREEGGKDREEAREEDGQESKSDREESGKEDCFNREGREKDGLRVTRSTSAPDGTIIGQTGECDSVSNTLPARPVTVTSIQFVPYFAELTAVRRFPEGYDRCHAEGDLH